MAGARQFDTEAAEAGITRAFRRHGFAATSIEAIEAETGLRRGSLYNAFGDKEAMFALALRRYAAEAAGRVFAPLAGGDPAASLAALFAAQLASLADTAAHGGCLVTEAMAAAPALPRAASAAVAAVAGEQAAGFEAAIRRWQEAGALDPGADAAGLARMLSAVMLGLATLVRATGDVAAARAGAAAAVRALDAFRPA